MRKLIQLIILILAVASLSGCTIHFKGENIELDADRQRVFQFDGVSVTQSNPAS